LIPVAKPPHLPQAQHALFDGRRRHLESAAGSVPNFASIARLLNASLRRSSLGS
jgi:hypothetical protein